MGERERSALRGKLAWLAGVAPFVCAAPARADPFDTGGGGVFMGYAFGERGGLEWGVEAFATRLFEEPEERCSPEPPERNGYGPVLRFSAVNNSRFEFTLAAHAGADLPDQGGFFLVDGELGASVLFESGHSTRIGPRYGALLESLIFNVHLRQAWLFAVGPEPGHSKTSVGGGLRLLPTLGRLYSCSYVAATPGRAYRNGRGDAQQANVTRGAGFDVKNPRAERWARRAAEECASVPAFLQLARELLDLDAPLELVARAVHAADEELGHTRIAAALAERFGKAPIRLSPPGFRERQSLPRTLALHRLAAENWQDGYWNEGRAAAELSLEAQQSDNALESRLLRRVAREEVTHAALAYDVSCWAISRLAVRCGLDRVAGDREHERADRQLHEDLVHGVTKELSSTFHIGTRARRVPSTSDAE